MQHRLGKMALGLSSPDRIKELFRRKLMQTAKTKHDETWTYKLYQVIMITR